VINLETSITRSRAFAPGKAVHYRMSPGNLPCAAAARPDACALANNHALDFGHRGLADTLDALSGAGLQAAGAGRDAGEARRPVAVPVPGGGRMVIFSYGTGSGGIPADWAAAPGRPGIDYLPDLSDATADEVTGRARAAKRPGDVVVVSIHWGSNWGYGADPDQVRFARRLVDGAWTCPELAARGQRTGRGRPHRASRLRTPDRGAARRPAVSTHMHPGRLERIKTWSEHTGDTRSVRLAVWLYRRTNGRIVRLWHRRALILTTSGRRSGLLRIVLVQYFPDGHNMVIVAVNNGMPHHPGWYFIQPEGHPLADVEIDGKR
jgi:hypothetical protein